MANWNILGAGAMGHFFAQQLLKSGQHVNFVLRPGHTAQPYPFIFADLQQQLSHNLVTAQSELTSKCDFLLVTLKAYQVLAALTPLQGRIDKHCCIVLMHNGMGTAEKVSQLFPNNAILIGTTSNGALKTITDKQQVLVKHTGQGITWFGAFNNKAKRHTDIAERLFALAECHWSDNIRETLWLKLIINCAINPLTAIKKCKNGALAEPENYAQVQAIVNELSIISQKAGLPWSAAELQTQVDSVFTRTADNFSSMQQDVFFQRQTEIDFITGYILRVAENYKLEAPINQRLFDEVKRLEASK